VAYPHVDGDGPMRERMYDFWSKKLFQLTGLDWLQCKQVYQTLGNSVGVYPDTLVAFANIIRFYDVKKILEFGSGFSTLFLACMARKQDAEFRSYEETEYYHQLTRTFLENYGYPGDLVQPWPKITPELFNGCEFLFLDNVNRGDLISQGHILFPNVPFIVVDDCDGGGNRVTCEFMARANRLHFYPFQCGGRMDRTQFIIYKPETSLPEFLYRAMGYL
jgi:hypothetical protein